MTKRALSFILAMLLAGLLLAGCGSTTAPAAATAVPEVVKTADPSAEPAVTEEIAEPQEEPAPAAESTAQPADVTADGKYLVSFETDGSMFHVNEICNGTAVLTVENGSMSVHVIMPSKNVLNLFSGMAEEASQPGAELLEPTVVEVTYPDGYVDMVNAFDIPVPVLDEEFNVALVGKKGNWYDHKVVVSILSEYSEPVSLADGEYSCEVTLEGGSGRATIVSPAVVTVENGDATAKIEWSSPFYDYMLVGGEKYLPINSEGNSVFVIPVSAFDEPLAVIADTTAMSTPHEVEYTLVFASDTLK